MYVDEICREASALAGVPSEKLEMYAAAAEAGLMRRLREGVSPENISGEFIAAASLMALSIYYSAEEGLSWTAGAVSVSRRDGKAAAALMAQAEALLSGYIDDGGFEFLGVEA
ncbi:MAG: hypothetical protein ACI3VB_05085 [Oscillospiraceae bacterium]